jgi:Ala-tRNA(Pro) deacylase
MTPSVIRQQRGKDNDIRTYDLLDSEYFGCHPCINTSSLRMRTVDLVEKVLPAMEHDFVKVKL